MSIVTGVLVIVGITGVIWLFLNFQRNMVYYPERTITLTPDTINLEYEDVRFKAEDGTDLHGWFVPADDNTQTTILYCHGNAGNISGRLETIRMLHQAGVNVFIFDYRGYGNSEGTPSENGTYNDAMGAWLYLTNQRNIVPDDILLMGRSLGGSVAAGLAVNVHSKAVIIESTFTSIPDMAMEIYPILPSKSLVRYTYPTLKYVQQIEAPKFFAHSKHDRLIPISHGKKIYEAAPEPKEFYELKGGHGDAFMTSGEGYRDALYTFINKHK